MAVSLQPRPAIHTDDLRLPVDMLAELASLKDDDEQGYDDEFLRPTDAGFELARELLCGSAECAPLPYPQGDIYPDGSGGIRADWRSDDRHVSFVLFADTMRRNYIYVQDGDCFGGDYDVTAARLGQYLTWLHNGDILPFGLQLHRLPGA
jgi:hypothetical protein